ncbi:ankyrin repeat domain-containing protein [Mycolicibacterium fortuitum]|uniref:ankyrin repeat domain-containing protein n=1 Tax=Mycolicibacterium fortuitum TaxID=1766 RepID=UPI0007EA131F|nr:ankyrin repeat domain-containing protein [Mycolicibacterium fortuitum]OBB32646.1 hypothetical protein A5763_11115 [Mycolicibacterium fortuitum]OBB43158.1 hypothetical protein A5754_13350 [Mycolicibacterium fortuitum]OBB64751.1 hypothetical protein A5755_21380 [Mycolicibacterium fortuitum]OBF82000.1 hypothetical protein A5751_15940 [Mycolicibacterium fortuitum]OBG09953.1 hypothetical protein A5768_15085 [Mycolicibacterium fortuitum]
MEEPLTWHGVLDPSLWSESFVADGHRIADAAKAGDWTTVLEMLRKDPHLGVNRWRPGSPKWFTILHQAAWHGASASVVSELLGHGALRSLRDGKGRTPQDVAVERGHAFALGQMLAPPQSPLDDQRVAILDQRLADVIDGRIREGQLDRGHSGGDLRSALRYPPVGMMHEAPGQSVWFAVPGMYGGFRITLRQGYLESSSWCRVVGGSGQLHVITHEGVVLADEGFV